MSNTPQTDAVFHWYYDSYGSRYAVIDKFAELCFKLERENTSLRDALNEIACWRDGSTVGSHFDEPCAAKVARDALAKTEAKP